MNQVPLAEEHAVFAVRETSRFRTIHRGRSIGDEAGVRAPHDAGGVEPGGGRAPDQRHPELKAPDRAPYVK